MACLDLTVCLQLKLGINYVYSFLRNLQHNRNFTKIYHFVCVGMDTLLLPDFQWKGNKTCMLVEQVFRCVILGRFSIDPRKTGSPVKRIVFNLV